MRQDYFPEPLKDLPSSKMLVKNILRDSRQPFIVAILVIIFDFLKELKNVNSLTSRPVWILMVGVSVLIATFFSSFLVEMLFYGQKYWNETQKVKTQNDIYNDVVKNVVDKREIVKIEREVTKEVVIMTASFFIEENYGSVIVDRIQNGVRYKYIIPKSKEEVFCNTIKKLERFSKQIKSNDIQALLEKVSYVTIADSKFIPQTIVMYIYDHEEETQPKYSIYTKLDCADTRNQIYYYENRNEAPQYEDGGKTVYPHGSKAAIKHCLDALLKQEKQIRCDI